MSVDANSAITQAALQALADLANTKLSPPVPFAFTSFSDKIQLPSDIAISATYGSGTFRPGLKVTLRLYGYQTVAGVKTYSTVPLMKAFYSDATKGFFTLKWSWTNATGINKPDGYIVSVPTRIGDGWEFFWKDIGFVSELTEDGTFPGWKIDVTLDANNIGNPDQNLPCAHGTWWKTFNNIRGRANLHTDVGCLNSGDVTGLDNIGGDELIGTGSVTTLGISALNSGPWCVGVSGGIGANTLTAWIARASIYVQGATQGFTQGFTQCFRAVKFYFRSADAPGGVNITAENKLTTFQIGSDLVTTTTAHYHLQVVSCSTGHLKVQDSGGGTIRADIDTVAGNVYDLSFDITGATVDGLTHPKSLDFTFTTPAATASVPDSGLELDNDIQSCSVPDSYCEIEFNNPILSNSSSYSTIQLCTSCLQLVLTEQNNTPGIWVANTLPTPGVMTYLDQDLPQYNSDTGDVTTRRTPLDGDLPYIPTVPNRGALWPVKRDTDFTPDSVAGKPVDGSLAWQSLGTKSVTVDRKTASIQPYEPGESLKRYATFVYDGTTELRFYTSNPNCIVYVKANSFPTVADNDFMASGGTWGMAPAGFPTGTVWFYAVQNNATTNVETETIAVAVQGDAPHGTFFNTIVDDDGNVVGAQEKYSYHFPGNGTQPLNPTPLLGYCVFALSIERMPQNNEAGVAIPSAAVADLPVNIGIMKGFGYSTAGNFQMIQSVILRAGTATLILPGFLPVLSGTFLTYQCTEQVNVVASVNFQPMMHSSFNPVKTKVSGSDYVKGFYNGAAWYEFTRSHVYFVKGSLVNPVVLQFSAAAYNDLENLLNLL